MIVDGGFTAWSEPQFKHNSSLKFDSKDNLISFRQNFVWYTESTSDELLFFTQQI